MASDQSIDRLLALPTPRPAAPSSTALSDPQERTKKHDRSRRPRHAEELLALVRRNADVAAVFIDRMDRLDDDRRRDGARDADEQEGEDVEREVEERGHPAGREHAPDRAEEGEAGQDDADHVEDEHDLRGDLDRFDRVFDLRGPVQVAQVQAGGELAFDDRRGIEVEERGAVRAVCDVFLCACGVVPLVVPFAVVHDVRGVEVVQVEGLRNVGGDVVDQVVDVSFDAVDQIAEEPAVAVGGVEEACVAKARGVESQQLGIW